MIAYNNLREITNPPLLSRAISQQLANVPSSVCFLIKTSASETDVHVNTPSISRAVSESTLSAVEFPEDTDVASVFRTSTVAT